MGSIYFLGKLLYQEVAGVTTYSATPLETEQFEYNIQGWLLGMNRDYVRDISSTSTTASTPKALGGKTPLSSSMKSILENTSATDGGSTNGTRYEVVKTHYDLPDNSHGLTAYVNSDADVWKLKGEVLSKTLFLLNRNLSRELI